ncbi:MAG TPA: class I SAM-dependent methyltransferase [Verrucomicrobiae bacterium]|nr:class I SAM-dependent methyltransferase [Verrucomicrobiae bacterium]
MSRTASSHWSLSLVNPALPSLVSSMQLGLRGCRSILDVGCGKGSPLRFLRGGQHLVGVDGFAPALEEARALATHDEYVVGDVRKLATLFPGRSFDACVALDVIEHLPKEDGWHLLDDMEKLAKMAALVFTPNGFVPQHSKNGDLQEHLSGWTVSDFRQRGYQVFGMCGPKSLRGEYHIIKRRPRAFWALVSLIIDYAYTRKHPETAAALLAVKRLS